MGFINRKNISGTAGVCLVISVLVLAVYHDNVVLRYGLHLLWAIVVGAETGWSTYVALRNHGVEKRESLDKSYRNGATASILSFAVLSLLVLWVGDGLLYVSGENSDAAEIGKAAVTAIAVILAAVILQSATWALERLVSDAILTVNVTALHQRVSTLEEHLAKLREKHNQ